MTSVTLKVVLTPDPRELKILQRVTCALGGGATWVVIPSPQPLASTMVMLYPPLARPVNVVLPPEVLILWVTPLTVTLYGGVPPLTLTVMVPSVAPGEVGAVDVADAWTADGAVIVCVCAGPVHPWLSFTLTVCEPAARLLNVAGDEHELKAPPSRLH